MADETPVAEKPADIEQLRQEMRDLFYERIYSKGDVILATEVSEKALEHMTKPNGPLRFVGATKQQGRRLQFQGHDILMIEVMRRLQFFGIPQYSMASTEARDFVSKRAYWNLNGLPGSGVTTLLLYPFIAPDKPDRTQWVVVPYREGLPDPWVPPATLLVGVDKLIDEVVWKLRALRDDTEMPRVHPLAEAARHALAQAQQAETESGRPSGPAESPATSRKKQAAKSSTPKKGK